MSINSTETFTSINTDGGKSETVSTLITITNTDIKHPSSSKQYDFDTGQF